MNFGKFNTLIIVLGNTVKHLQSNVSGCIVLRWLTFTLSPYNAVYSKQTSEQSLWDNSSIMYNDSISPSPIQRKNIVAQFLASGCFIGHNMKITEIAQKIIITMFVFTMVQLTSNDCKIDKQYGGEESHCH